MSINSVTISGNLGQDPELKSTQGGTSVLRFRMAVNERRKDQGGEWADYANWVTCVVFGNRADGIAPYLSKGSKVCVQGHLRYSQWEKDGQSRSSLDVIVDEIEFMSRSDQSAAQPAYQPQPTSYPQQPQPPVYGAQDAPQGYSQAAQMAQQMAQQAQPSFESVYQEDIPFN